MDYSKLATEEAINTTKTNLEKNGFTVLITENGQKAKLQALELLPLGAAVMTMTSVTTDSIGLTKEINESGKYSPVRSKLYGTEEAETYTSVQKKEFGAAPEYVTGSVHAVTQSGSVIIASGTGSQLPAYAYGSEHVIWIVGTQKIVEDAESGFKRIYDYVLPLESVRANAAYGITTGSSVNKVLIINKENTLNRITIILVKELLGY